MLGLVGIVCLVIVLKDGVKAFFSWSFEERIASIVIAFILIILFNFGGIIWAALTSWVFWGVVAIASLCIWKATCPKKFPRRKFRINM